MAKKLTAAATVAAQIDTLKKMSVSELTHAGKDAGFDSRAGFAAWKKALAAAGIDYEAMRDARREERAATRESAIAHEITLYTDAKASMARFAVCDEDGSPVWYGRFFDEERTFNGEQSSGELAAALKAVWLAGKAAAALGGVVRLTLKVDADWLTWANSTDPRKGGKALELKRAADRAGIVLSVEHIPGTRNPADKYTVCSGFQKWQEYSPGLAGLVSGANRKSLVAANERFAAPVPSVVEPEPVAPITHPEPIRDARPLDAGEMAQLDAVDLDVLVSMKRRERKDWLFKANLPNRAEALDYVTGRLESAHAV